MGQNKWVMSHLKSNCGERVNPIKIAHLMSGFAENSGFMTIQFVSQNPNTSGGQLKTWGKC